MNYLAHAFLSFQEQGILTGNMISDFVKGKRQYDYPHHIQKGIQLHRYIDTFTDCHAATAKAKSFFRKDYRLYSGAFVDVVYDHFLACDALQYIKYDGLENFTISVYASLEKDFEFFPAGFQRIFPYMKTQNWLYNYRLRDGIRRGFEGLAYRAAYLNESAVAYELFNQHYDELKTCYEAFFPEVKKFAVSSLSNLLPD
ncbi:MAG: ACP phosphodiesterase [Ginsengibacter sp.]